ncbi:nicotinate-nucleotide adenylyltransferase [Aquibacillus sediminis]|uniref:nicotinate-nucleotide adenylyltransferase n=1 Tax=Aquibacillus sediminis TaxID=2574734 RepID=UPI001108715B|nr:nicotinate-nucleotide adenylyltransferase [Aquibacillus sediminis]
MKKVGLLGGTFDPPHYGHLLIGEEVYNKLDLDEVWFIPSFEPPHKDKATTSASNRIAMVEAAIHDNPHFKLNTIEVERSEKSYTIHTIEVLQEQYPNITFYFIIGADMVEYLPNWYDIDRLMEKIKFVGVKRADYQLNTDYPVIEVDIPGLEISSTLIRDRIAQGESINYLTPPQVIDLIKEAQLYGKK